MDASPATAHMFIIKPFSGQSMMRLFSTHPSTEQRIAAPPGDALMHEVRVNRKGAGAVASGHPWIFASDVVDRAAPQPGVGGQSDRSLAAVRSGTAHYSFRLADLAAPALASTSKRSAASSSCGASRAAAEFRRRRGREYRRLPRGLRRSRPAAGAGGGPLRRLPGHADARPGHGRGHRRIIVDCLRETLLAARHRAPERRRGARARKTCRSNRASLVGRGAGGRRGAHERP